MPGRFNPDDYVDCQERINRFWEEYPDGAIWTELLSSGDVFETVVIRAMVFKQRPTESRHTAMPDASGIAAEMKGGNGANSTSWHENGETSAIGRALANLGYATSRSDRPSKQEMQKAERHGGDDLPARTRTTSQNTVRDEPAEEERYPSGVTKKQVRTIGAIANALGLEPEKVKAMHGKPSATELTSAEASALITALRELETKAKSEQSSMAGLVRNVDRNFA